MFANLSNLFVELKNNDGLMKSLQDNEKIEVTVRDKNKSVVTKLLIRCLDGEVSVKTVFSRRTEKAE